MEIRISQKLKEEYPSQYYVLNIIHTSILFNHLDDELANLIKNYLSKDKNNLPTHTTDSIGV